MADNETRVRYKAIADFSTLSRDVAKLRKQLKELRAEEGKQNTQSKNDANRVSTAYDKKAKSVNAANDAMREQLALTKTLNTETGKNKRSQEGMISVFAKKKKAVDDATGALRRHSTAQKTASAAGSISSGNRSIASSFDAKQKSVDKATTALREHTTATKDSTREDRGFQSTLSGTENLLSQVANAVGKNARALRSYRTNVDSGTRSGVRFRRAQRDINQDIREFPRITSQASRGANNFFGSLRRLGNWRPRFIPPFVALIPAIAGALAALNPLVALFGAAGGAAIGFASSLGSLAGAALALPGILGAVAGGVSALIASFSGIGGAFKAFGQMQKSGGGGGGGGGGAAATYRNQAQEIQRATEDIANAQQDLGRAYEDAAEDISDAERRVERAQKDAVRAQEDLNEARRDALRDLIDLRKEVSRAGVSEERAIANLTQAQEEYYAVLADPGSTLGDKQDALAAVKEAEQDLADVRDDNTRNAEDLAEAEKKGVEGADQVVDAREALTDALEEQSDAYRDLQRAREDEARSIQDAQRKVEDAYEALRKAQESDAGGGGGGGGGGGLDAFQEALDKLSPSARAFVLGILSMKDAWDAMVNSVQETFFSRIVGDLETLRSLIPNVGTVLNKFAAVLGDLAHDVITLFASAEWQKDFLQFGDDGSKIIKELGRGGLALAEALKDIIMAAAPFTDWLVTSLATGAENFRDLVNSARESGALASWLDKVRSRLEQWWRIIKNVGMTLFNYGSAAGDFGKWITDGLEALTKGWLGSSEDANKENSKFKQWLEDIKPLLTEVKDLAAAFFGWFAREASDKNNLQQMQDILETIRTDLGPAISQLLDNLSKSGLGKDLIDTLAAIVDAIADVVDAGGGESFKAFFGILKEFFGAVSDFVKIPGVADVLKGVGTALGVIAAISFIGKFTGLTNLLTFLVANRLAIMDVLVTGFGKLDKMKFASLLKMAGVVGALLTLQQLFDAIPEDKDPKDGLEPDVTKSQGSAAVTGGMIGMLGGPIGALLGFGIGAAAGTPKESWDNGADQWKDSIENGPFGKKSFDNGWKQITDSWDNTNTFLEDGFANIFNGDNWTNGMSQIVDVWNGFVGWLGDLWQGVVDWWNDGWDDTVQKFQNGWKQIETWWKDTNQAIQDGWNGFVAWLGSIWDGFVSWLGSVWQGIIDLWNGFLGWLGDVWNGIVGLWNGFMGWLADVWNGIVSLWNGFLAWLGSVWNGVISVATAIWGFIQSLWNGAVNAAKAIWNVVQSWWGSAVDTAKGIWNTVQQWWGDAVNTAKGIWDSVSTWFKNAADGIGGFFSGIYDGIVGAVRGAFDGVSSFLSGIFGNIGGLVPPTKPGPVTQTPSQADRSDAAKPSVATPRGGHYNRGGDIPHFAGGGRLKSNNGSKPFRQIGTDTVPAMLTPGEFILRKSIVNAIGKDNLLALNSGVMSYADMLNGFLRDQKNVDKQREKPKDQSTGMMDYFDGGGLAGGTALDGATISRNDYSSSLGKTETVSNDYGFHVDKLIVQNPVPEPASDSLPRAIRKVAYLTSARGPRR